MEYIEAHEKMMETHSDASKYMEIHRNTRNTQKYREHMEIHRNT